MKLPLLLARAAFEPLTGALEPLSVNTPSANRGASLHNKLGTVFIIQALAVSCATLLGIYACAVILEDVLIRRALQDEAGHFDRLLDVNPQAAAPNTFNMRGYLAASSSAAQLPAELAKLPPGYHNIRLASGKRPLVYVSDTRHGRLTLVFDQQNVGRLALLFGLVPLLLVLVFIYLASLAAYRFSRRAISPVIWLANEVASWDAKTPDSAALSPERMPSDLEGETQILAEALRGYSSRIAELVERERTFTRDASHELRSPLTVIKLACEVILTDGDFDDATPSVKHDKFLERNIRRIEAASRDMEALIEAFLLLARDSASGLPEDDLCINDIIREEIERAEPLLTQKRVELKFNEAHLLKLTAPSKVVAVMIGNLIRNACRYTDAGAVAVSIAGKSVTICDTGRGMSPSDLEHIFQPFFRGQGAPRGGHGVGLTIVQRLSDRFAWPVSLKSELGVGTTAVIEFPEALIELVPR
jgi:signal transduction histidine kinase